MQTVEIKSAQEWESVIADLTAKAEGFDNEVAELSAEADGLALDSAMGYDGAAKRLTKLGAEIATKTAVASNLRTAIEQAQQRLEEARAAEADEAEQTRRANIATNMAQYADDVQRIDDGLRQLVAAFTRARQTLDRAEALMTPMERQPFQQLRSLWGPTLAAAHFGLGDFIELGPRAGNFTHQQPLAAFTAAYAEQWIKPSEEQDNGG